MPLWDFPFKGLPLPSQRLFQQVHVCVPGEGLFNNPSPVGIDPTLRSRSPRICPHFPSPDFRAGGVCWRGRPSASGFRVAEAVRTAGVGRLPGAARGAHFPAVAVTGNETSGSNLGGWLALRRPLSGASGFVFHRGPPRNSPHLPPARLRGFQYDGGADRFARRISNFRKIQ